MRPYFTAALLALPSALHAEPMTLDSALSRAASEAPELQSREAGVDAAQSAAIAADRLPDPKLNIVLQDFPVTGPDAGRFNRDDFTMQVIGVSQDFPNPAKRRARATRAQADIGIARADEAVTAQDIRLATALAWVDLYYAKKELKELDLLDSGLEDLQSTVTARLASGAARPAQALEPDQLRAAINDRRSALAAEIARARAQLARFTGDPAADTLGDLPPQSIDEQGLRAGIDALPKLRALVTVDLPFFSKKRQDPKIAARASEAMRARLDREAAKRDIAAALDADLADHRMHHEQLANARTRLVPLAKKRAELDLASYAAGKLDLGTALLSTLALAEAEVDALAREAEVARDAIRINYIYGEAGR